MTASQLATPPPRSSAAAGGIFPRVLFAIDFGAASLGAARWAATHAASRADAVLLHVVPDVDERRRGRAACRSQIEQAESMTPALAGGLAGFAATLSVTETRTVVRSGRPSGCLATVADETEADLLVLGRRADANRVRVGEPNVIERAARRTNASVLVVPEGTSVAPACVVAALDDSRYAPTVLRLAIRFARMHDARLIVLHVLPPVVGAYARVIRSAKHPFADARIRELGRARVSMSPPSLDASTTRWFARLAREHDLSGDDASEVAIGDPAREIVRTATDDAASLVVVGMRGADAAPQGSIGSVARELLTRGPTPVLAVNMP